MTNWALVLSDYPHSVLKSEMPVVVLAFLEQSGITTEDNLVTQLKIDPKLLARILLELYQNRFVIFGKHSIRVSELGKSLLERLSLDDSLIEDLLDRLSISEEYRDTYKKIFMLYRDQAFPQYLNSLGTLQVLAWVFAREKQAQPDQQPSVAEKAGMLAIMLRDIRNWRWFRHPSDEMFRRLSIESKQIITYEHLETLVMNIPLHDLESTACHFVVHMANPSRIKVKEKSKEKEFNTILKYLRSIDGIQKRFNKDTWYDALCDYSLFDTKKNSSKYVFKHLFQTVENSGYVSYHHETALLGGSHWWNEGRSNEFTADFLTKLMLTSSLEDLANSLGMDESSVGTLVMNIRAKCDELLSGEKGRLKNGEEALKSR